jgi:hypothetical protein
LPQVVVDDAAVDVVVAMAERFDGLKTAQVMLLRGANVPCQLKHRVV